jgi:hypothetical protein
LALCRISPFDRDNFIAGCILKEATKIADIGERRCEVITVERNSTRLWCVHMISHHNLTKNEKEICANTFWSRFIFDTGEYSFLTTCASHHFTFKIEGVMKAP